VPWVLNVKNAERQSEPDVFAMSVNETQPMNSVALTTSQILNRLNPITKMIQKVACDLWIKTIADKRDYCLSAIE
jgi:hypothetical protein